MTQIENEMQYEAAMERIEELLKVVDDDTPENDKDRVELVLLSNLVGDYEDIHYEIPRPTLPSVLKLRMYEMGMSQTSLAKFLGMNQSKLSEIIAGKCEPTFRQARTMCSRLDISAEVALGL
jgi:HTH-type transcriptional regulator/antitoxin HigA